jgi:hypothetical protein
MAEYAEFERFRAEHERRWERISDEMDKEARRYLDAVGRATSISEVIDIVKQAGRRLRRYIDTTKRECPEYVDDAIVKAVIYNGDIRSRGVERITEIYYKLVGGELT